MMMQRTALLASFFALPACSASNVQVPSEIQSSGKKIAFTWSKGISGKDPVNFAPYKADAMDIGWQSSSGSKMGIGAFSSGSTTSEQKYKFNLSREGAKLSVPVACVKSGSESGKAIAGISIGGESKSALNCTLDKAKLVAEGAAGGFTGKVSDISGAKDIQFAPVFIDDKGATSKQVLGYELTVDGKKSAVINLGAERAYWYVPQTGEAADLNLAATAIALFISAQ